LFSKLLVATIKINILEEVPATRCTQTIVTFTPGEGGGGGTPYSGVYGEAPPQRGTFSKLTVY